MSGPEEIRTAAQVDAYIAAIRAASGDPEMAQQLERSLYMGVLRAIAAGHAEGDPGALSGAALKAEAVDFSRWFA